MRKDDVLRGVRRLHNVWMVHVLPQVRPRDAGRLRRKRGMRRLQRKRRRLQLRVLPRHGVRGLRLVRHVHEHRLLWLVL